VTNDNYGGLALGIDVTTTPSSFGFFDCLINSVSVHNCNLLSIFGDDCFTVTHQDTDKILFDVNNVCSTKSFDIIVSDGITNKTELFLFRELYNNTFSILPKVDVNDVLLQLRYIPSHIQNIGYLPMKQCITVQDTLGVQLTNATYSCTYNYYDEHNLLLQSSNTLYTNFTSLVSIYCEFLNTFVFENITVNASEYSIIKSLKDNLHNTIRISTYFNITQVLHIPQPSENEKIMETNELDVQFITNIEQQENLVLPLSPLLYFTISGTTNPLLMIIHNNSHTEYILYYSIQNVINGSRTNMVSNFLPVEPDINLGNNQGVKYKIIDNVLSLNFVPVLSSYFEFFFTVVDITIQCNGALQSIINYNQIVELSTINKKNIRFVSKSDDEFKTQVSFMTFENSTNETIGRDCMKNSMCNFGKLNIPIQELQFDLYFGLSVSYTVYRCIESNNQCQSNVVPIYKNDNNRINYSTFQYVYTKSTYSTPSGLDQGGLPSAVTPILGGTGESSTDVTSNTTGAPNFVNPVSGITDGSITVTPNPGGTGGAPNFVIPIVTSGTNDSSVHINHGDKYLKSSNIKTKISYIENVNEKETINILQNIFYNSNVQLLEVKTDKYLKHFYINLHYMSLKSMNNDYRLIEVITKNPSNYKNLLGLSFFQLEIIDYYTRVVNNLLQYSSPPSSPPSFPPNSPPSFPPSSPPNSPPSFPPSSPPKYASVPICSDIETSYSSSFPVKLKLSSTYKWYNVPCGLLDKQWLTSNNLENTAWDWSTWGCNSNTEKYGHKRGISFIARQNCPISCGICDVSKSSKLIDIWDNNWSGSVWAKNPLPQKISWNIKNNIPDYDDNPNSTGRLNCKCI